MSGSRSLSGRLLVAASCLMLGVILALLLIAGAGLASGIMSVLILSLGDGSVKMLVSGEVCSSLSTG